MVKPLRKIDIKKVVSLLGTVIMIVSLYFVVMRIIEMRDGIDLTVLANVWVLIPLLLVVLAESTAVLFTSENFRKIVAGISGINISRPIAIKAYNNANIYKYIPGGVMLLIGRNQMAIETDELKHSKVALATVLEGALWIVSALILSSVFSLDYVLHYIRQLEFQYTELILGAALLAVLLVIFILFRFRHKLFGDTFDIKNETKGLRITALIKRFPVMLVIVSFWGFSFMTTMAILGQPITFSLGITIAGLYIMSWLIGFLTPGAPGGLGIREIVLLMFLGATIYEGLLLSAIVIHRAIQVVSDLVAFAIAHSYAYKKAHNKQVET
ncbi:MAG: hypothetical protein FWC20_07780 [Oscillospiraceae bacterium]|nr:hypothetical protein [Oscillospiraceae bacterium]MCL2279289.1 hypothetical protein [Oscillospiraceae bacterium]